MIASQLSAHCDVISSRLWRHQQNENRAGGRYVKIVVFIVIHGAHSSVIPLFIYRHQNHPLVSTITVRHSSPYIILYKIPFESIWNDMYMFVKIVIPW